MEGISELETRAINPSLHSISMMFTKKKNFRVEHKFHIYYTKKKNDIHIFKF